MIRPIVLLLSSVLCLAMPVAAQRAAYTPAPGTAERAAIMDAVRATTQRQLRGQQVRFVAHHLRAMNGWAFLFGEPRRVDGRRFDYRGTPYQEAFEAGAFDSNVSALLHREGGRWRVVAFDMGATDVVWEDWPTRYHAPPQVFPSYGR